MLTVAIYIQDTTTLEYNRVDLFDDEKISVVSSIQNINDISKTYTDYSKTVIVPASKQNNKIFRHWYDNSNDSPFSTLVKSNAYIEIDTITFRKGKIQLESANVVDGNPQNYSITFIGVLGNLKDTFAGKYLKDLPSEDYNVVYNSNYVGNKVVSTTTSADIMFPLISSNRNWNYGKTGTNDISLSAYPINYNELFPALRVSKIFDLIENEFGLNFNGTFLTDSKFLNAYLWLKNAEQFVPYFTYELLPLEVGTGFPPDSINIPAIYKFQSFDTTLRRFTAPNQNTTAYYNQIFFDYRRPSGSTSTGYFQLELWNVSLNVSVYISPLLSPSFSTSTETLLDSFLNNYQGTIFEIRIRTFTDEVDFNYLFTKIRLVTTTASGVTNSTQTIGTSANYTTNLSTTPLLTYMPEIKIEDFFSGILKMFNLTCYSSDGINYTVEQLESYYSAGLDIDITKYVIQDKKDLNRVKTYKRINFEYEKSESFVNVAFNSANGIEYGTLYYSSTPPSDGEEYSIKLPFEDLGFLKLKNTLQVAYALKNDGVTKYIPKPVILYDYNSTALTTCPQFYFNSIAYTAYKAFGQETLISGQTYGLNFPPQQSTLTNEYITKGLYNQYYENYFANIFNIKARLIKVSAILPTSILTSLKLNDNIIIRDAKYIINTMNTDLTTGEVQFELLTDTRI